MQNKLILFLLITMYISGCVQSDICSFETNAVVKVAFYSNETEPTAETVEHITIQGRGNDSLLHNDTSLLGAKFYMDSENDSTIYDISFDNNVFGTITFNYKVVYNYLNDACGFAVEYDSINAEYFQETKFITIELIDTTYINHEFKMYCYDTINPDIDTLVNGILSIPNYACRDTSVVDTIPEYNSRDTIVAVSPYIDSISVEYPNVRIDDNEQTHINFYFRP